jgi:hypothetical protein
MKSTIDQQQGTISGNIRSYSTALHSELQALGAEEGGIAFNALGGIVAEMEGIQQLETIPLLLGPSIKPIERAFGNAMMRESSRQTGRNNTPSPVSDTEFMEMLPQVVAEHSVRDGHSGDVCNGSILDTEAISSAILRHIATLRKELVRLGAEEGGTAFHALNGIASEVERISGLEAFSPEVFHVEDAHSGKLLAQVDGEDEETRREQFKNATCELAYMDAR